MTRLGADSEVIDSRMGWAIVKLVGVEAPGIESSTPCVDVVGVDVVSSFDSVCADCMSTDFLESMLDLGLAGWFRGVVEREGFRLAAALANFACNRSLTREREGLREVSEEAFGTARAVGASADGFSLAAALS